jgi:hypothetical protein
LAALTEPGRHLVRCSEPTAPGGGGLRLRGFTYFDVEVIWTHG